MAVLKSLPELMRWWKSQECADLIHRLEHEEDMDHSDAQGVADAMFSNGSAGKEEWKQYERSNK